ncbi:ribonuclease H family protein [Lignipirellula cremea]|nr:hypothetical protein [Lignipirellula cremea]
MSYPHYLLLAEAAPKASQTGGVWRFVLQALESGEHLEAADEEPAVSGVRLELLAVVRGLEAIGQPSRVTLVTRNAYISRTLRLHLDNWRDSGWMWERFDDMAPITNADLWRRIDGALHYHRVECRTWRFDEPSATVPAPHFSHRSRNRRTYSLPQTDDAAVALEHSGPEQSGREPSRREPSAQPDTRGWLRGVAARLCGDSMEKLKHA